MTLEQRFASVVIGKLPEGTRSILKRFAKSEILERLGKSLATVETESKKIVAKRREVSHSLRIKLDRY